MHTQTDKGTIARLLSPTQALFLAAALIVGCDSQTSAPEANEETSKAYLGKWGIELENIAGEVSPGDDFYRYVNQGWLDSAEIPEGLPYNGAFIELSLRVEDQIGTLVEKFDSGTTANTTAMQQLEALYRSYLNQAQRDTAGLTPIAPMLDNIQAAQNHDDVTALMATTSYPSVISASVIQNPQQPDQYLVAVGQAGLGLPNRDYYLEDSEPYPAHRKAYLDYITATLQRAGDNDAAKQAGEILAMETQLAQAHWTTAESRNVVKLFHSMTREELLAYAPEFNWDVFFNRFGASESDHFVVAHDSAIQATAQIFSTTPVATLQSYSRFHLLDNFSPYLGSDWEQAHFDFFSTQLKGIEQPRSKQKRAIELLNSMLGEELGKAYVEEYFPKSSKAQMQSMIDFIRQSFDQHIASNDWMDDTTRQAAFEKLHAFGVKIGYPDKWHDRSDITLSPDNLPENLLAIQQWTHQDNLSRLKSEYRDWEWEMAPQMVNAYYASLRNEIVFPAAILQPPFFDPQADPAVNFGAIGVVIGHEMGHGFDDQGSRFDAQGTLRNWWTDEARQAFEKKAQRLVEQYNQYSPLPNVPVNGQLTLGENIGDMTGVSIAWTAWKKFEKEHYPGGAPVMDGYSGDQRFFMGYAQLWRTLKTDEITRQLILSDTHSPGEFRVNGILRNFAPWYETYSVTSDQALYLPVAQRVSIW